VPAFAPPPDAPSHERASRAELAAYYRVTVRTIRRWGIGTPGHRGRTGPRVKPAKIDDPPSDPTSLEDDELAAADEVTTAEVRRTTARRRYNPAGRPRRPVDVDEVVRRYQAGASLKTVGRALGITADTVRTALIQAGVSRRPAVLSPRSDLDTDDVRRRYEAGESVYAIARTLRSTEHLVRKAIERAGMERPLRKLAEEG
jgi:hypothetical protein